MISVHGRGGQSGSRRTEWAARSGLDGGAMELGAGGAAGPGQRGGAEPGRLLLLLLGGGGGGGSGWAWPSGGGGGEGGTGTDTETGPEPDYEALPRGSAASTHMLAGAVAGVLEHSLMYPVDCVKVRTDGSSRVGIEESESGPGGVTSNSSKCRDPGLEGASGRKIPSKLFIVVLCFNPYWWTVRSDSN